MNFSIIPKIVDYSILTLSIIILIFCWIRFYTHQIINSLIVAIIVGATIGIFLFYFRLKKEKNIKLSKLEKDRIYYLSNQLSFCTQDTILNFFYELLKQNNVISQKKQNYLLTKDKILFPFFKKDKLDIIDIKEILNQIKNVPKELIIFCNDYTKESIDLSQKITTTKIIFLNMVDIIKRYKNFDNNNIPQTINITKQKTKWVNILQFALDKSKTKTYILVSSLLLLYSFYVPYKIYYLFFGSILIILAIITRILPYIKKNR